MSGGDKDDPIPFTLSEARTVLRQPSIERQMARKIEVDARHWDIPYLAGYSKDGSKIYIDRDMPKLFVLHGRRIDTDEFLVLHERVEKSIIDALRESKGEDQILLACLRMKSPTDRVYFHAHGVATRAELHAVSLKYGSAVVPAYDRFMRAQVKRAEGERIGKVPPDLDLTPYGGEDVRDRRLRAAMKKAMA